MIAPDASGTATTDHAASRAGMGVTAAGPPAMPALGGDNRTRVLGEVLQRIGVVLGQQGNRQWTFRTGESKRTAEAVLTDHWLSLSLALRPMSGLPSPERIGAMLRRNGRLRGSARIIGFGPGRQRQLVIDIPAEILPWEAPLELQALLARVNSELHGAPVRPSGLRPVPTDSGLTLAKIRDWCRDSGWPAEPAGSLDLQIPLDVPGRYLTARVDLVPGSVRLSLMPLARESESVAVPVHAAAMVLLWLVACRVRMVKPFCRSGLPGVEVVLHEEYVNDLSLAHACAVLSITARQLVPVAELLINDRRLAEIYLDNMGFSRRRDDIVVRVNNVETAKAVKEFSNE